VLVFFRYYPPDEAHVLYDESMLAQTK